jgi:hypothetical protein
MENDFASSLQAILRLGLIDDRYPLDHACVCLPNGWYGVDSVLGGLSECLSKYEYDEMLLPTISTKVVFNSIPPALKGNIDEKVLRITHTGLHKLEDPFYLSGRPELIVPQIEKMSARSYRDLPCRRLMRGFRYILSASSKELSLVTDTEFPALDAEAILASEEEYKAEIVRILSEVELFLRDALKLSTVIVDEEYAKVFYSVLPNCELMEVARLRLFGQDLASALGFSVLGKDNKWSSPFILDLNVTSKLFVAVIAAHSNEGGVVLPRYCLRNMGSSFGVDVSKIGQGIRIEAVRQSYSQEIFDKFVKEGRIFALEHGEEGKVKILTETTSFVVKCEEVESVIEKILEERESELSALEKKGFTSRLNNCLRLVGKGESAPEGFSILGEKDGLVATGKVFAL